MTSPTILWHAEDLVIATAVLVMFRRGLAKRYTVWWVFLVLQLVRDLALAQVPFSSLRYARSFMVSEIIVDAVLAASVYEWFRLLTGHYPGIRLAGTWFLHIGGGISFLVCLATVGPDWRAIDWNSPQFGLVLLVRHVIVGILGIFTILVFLAFQAYRVRVRPNVIWHGLLLMAYLLVQYVLAIADAKSRFVSLHLTNPVREVAGAFLYAGWAILLTRRGEEIEIPARLTENERVQLDRLNDEILTLARRTIRGI